jgi:hypothetical protein
MTPWVIYSDSVGKYSVSLKFGLSAISIVNAILVVGQFLIVVIGVVLLKLLLQTLDSQSLQLSKIWFISVMKVLH